MQKFAIVYPVYNTAGYLDESLNSILNQTYSNFEIFCVDDGSTDGSLDILKNYEQRDSRVKVIAQNNMGVATARNSALKEIFAKNDTFDWVLFFDSDDKVAANCLERCAQVGYGVDLVLFSYLQFNSKGICQSSRIVPQKESILDHRQTCEHYFRLNEWSKGNTTAFLGLQNKCFSYSLVRGVYFDSSLRVAEDQDYMIRLLANVNKSKVIPDALYFYRLRSSSLSHTVFYSDFSNDFRVYQRYLGNHNFSKSMRNGIQHRYLVNLWGDIRKVLGSDASLYQKYNFFKTAYQCTKIKFEFPLSRRENKRLRIIKLGFVLNLLMSKLKNYRSKSYQMDI